MKQKLIFHYYSCSQYDGYANLSAWVLTRDPYPTLDTIEQCLDIFIDNGVEVADFISFSQENCDYGIVDSNSCELWNKLCFYLKIIHPTSIRLRKPILKVEVDVLTSLKVPHTVVNTNFCSKFQIQVFKYS